MLIPAASIKGQRVTTKATKARQSEPLMLHTRDFANFSAGMIVLAEMAPERMTLSQGIFFMLTATADLAGKDPTFSDIKEAVGDTVNRSLHTTYRILMEPSRVYPNALGWLKAEPNPMDAREKFLRLTPKGRAVMVGVLRALGHDVALGS
jgi:hypothetical protein